METSRTNKNLSYDNISNKIRSKFFIVVHQKINKINNNSDYSKSYFAAKVLNKQNINQGSEPNATKENNLNLVTTNNSKNRNIYPIIPCYGEKPFNTFLDKTKNFDENSPHSNKKGI